MTMPSKQSMIGERYTLPAGIWNSVMSVSHFTFGAFAWKSRLIRFSGAGLISPSLSAIPKWVVADRGYTSHAFRQHIWNIGARPAIPPLRHQAPVACPSWIYNNRNRVERLWARLKEWRAVATRYEKTAASFFGVLCLAAALDWLKR